MKTPGQLDEEWLIERMPNVSCDDKFIFCDWVARITSNEGDTKEVIKLARETALGWLNELQNTRKIL
jgi:hypothetical protein